MTVAVHLSKADFCACCENVVEQGSGSLCPMCGSQAIRPLAAFLNRDVCPQCGSNNPVVYMVECGPSFQAPGERGAPHSWHSKNTLPHTMPELSQFIQIATPERIRELLGRPSEG